MATEITATVTELADYSLVNLAVKNQGPAIVYLGSTNSVTADQSADGGYPLAPGESVLLINRPSSEEYLWAITPEGSAYVSVIGS